MPCINPIQRYMPHDTPGRSLQVEPELGKFTALVGTLRDGF